MTDQPQPIVVDGVPLCSTRDCCRFRCDAEGWWCGNEHLQLNVLFCVPAVRDLARKAAALDAMEKYITAGADMCFTGDEELGVGIDIYAPCADRSFGYGGYDLLAAIEACVAEIEGKKPRADIDAMEEER